MFQHCVHFKVYSMQFQCCTMHIFCQYSLMHLTHALNLTTADIPLPIYLQQTLLYQYICSTHYSVNIFANLPLPICLQSFLCQYICKHSSANIFANIPLPIYLPTFLCQYICKHSSANIFAKIPLPIYLQTFIC